MIRTYRNIVFLRNNFVRVNHVKYCRFLSSQIENNKNQRNDQQPKLQNDWTAAKPFEEIPGPTGFEFIKWFMPRGKLYNKSFKEFFKLLNDTFGETLKLPGLFGKRGMVLTYNSNEFEKIFRSEGIWPIRQTLDVMKYYRTVIRKDVYEGAKGLTVSNGEEWANFRSIANPVLMQPKTIRIYVPRMDNVASDFVENIRMLRDASTLEVPDNFLDHISNWTLESVCLVALDTKLDIIKGPSKYPDAIKLKNAMSIFFDLLFQLDIKPSLWKIIPTPKYNKIIKSMDIMTEITKKYVEEAYRKLKNNQSDETNSDTGSVLQRLSMIDKKFAITMSMDLLVAGVDTTASAFTACLICLAKNPEKQEILRKEIMEILPEKDTPFTDEKMKHLPYLRACIKEGLRVHAITPGNARTIDKDLVIGGYRVPKGTDVLMPFILLFQNDEHFAESKKFIPERWLRKSLTEISKCPFSNGEGKSTNPFIYLPFGFGPRMCIGKRLVDMELEIGLAKIIRNFKVEFNYPDDKLFKANIINIPNMPLKFKFIDV